MSWTLNSSGHVLSIQRGCPLSLSKGQAPPTYHLRGGVDRGTHDTPKLSLKGFLIQLPTPSYTPLEIMPPCWYLGQTPNSEVKHLFASTRTPFQYPFNSIRTSCPSGINLIPMFLLWVFLKASHPNDANTCSQSSLTQRPTLRESLKTGARERFIMSTILKVISTI